MNQRTPAKSIIHSQNLRYFANRRATNKSKYFFLWSVFLCTSGFITTEVTVIGIVSHSTTQNNLGAGAGIFFCILGTLIASVGLPYCKKYSTRKLALSVTVLSYIVAGILWMLHRYIPLLLLSYLAAIIYSAMYIILNYCLCVSVYCFDQQIDRDKIAKQIVLPSFIAQAVMPLIIGWLFDVHGIEAVVAIIALAYSAPTLVIFCIRENPRIHQPNENLKISTTQGVPGIVSFIAVISSFSINWYLSSLLTSFSQQNISTLMIGGGLSILNLAGIAGAGLVTAISINHMRHQIKMLFISSLILSPGILLIHSIFDTGITVSTVILVSLAGVLIGTLASLSNSASYKLFDAENYIHYHRFLSLLTISSSLVGSLLGILFTSKIGLSVSLIICSILCALSSVKPALSIFTNSGKLHYDTIQ